MSASPNWPSSSTPVGSKSARISLFDADRLSWILATAVATRDRQSRGTAARFVLSLLAIQVALASVYDIRVLFLLDGGHSDAETMARLFLLPAWLWASLWMLMSVGMLTWTLWMTRKL